MILELLFAHSVTVISKTKKLDEQYVVNNASLNLEKTFFLHSFLQNTHLRGINFPLRQ